MPVQSTNPVSPGLQGGTNTIKAEDTQKTGCVFDIQRFSLDDGPGIRTTVFLKGCNQVCPWCHNPESISPLPQLFYAQNLCVKCGKCIAGCPEKAISLENGRCVTDSFRCDFCRTCIEVCPVSCRRVIGAEMSVRQVMETVMKDESYYRESRGGVTFSGGEPTLQADFLFDLLRCSKEEGLHTAIETNGNCDWSVYDKLLPYLDLVLIDLKHADDAIHRDVIGVSNHTVLKTLKELRGRVETEVRVPVIPQFNDTEKQLQDIVDIVGGLCFSTIRFLPYHTFGISKYNGLGMQYEYPVQQSLPMESLVKLVGALDTDRLTVSIGN